MGIIDTKNLNKEHVTSNYLRKYDKISLLTNAHLEGYQTGGAINVGRGKSSAKLSAPFREAQKQGCRIGVTPCMKNTKLTAIYYNPEKPAAFSTLDKLAAAIPRKTSLISKYGWNIKMPIQCIGLPEGGSYAIPKP